jgi:hypothetical protein
MPHDVFISYSAKDKGAAELICARLESAGIGCWMAPRDIRPGMSWGRAIIGAIDGARMVLLLFSQHANTSPQVTREVERAVQEDLTIIPVRIENVAPAGDLEYFLGTPQWLNAMPPEQHLDRILDSVEYWLPRGAPTKITPIARTPPPRQPERGAQNLVLSSQHCPPRGMRRHILLVGTSVVLVGMVVFLALRLIGWIPPTSTRSGMTTMLISTNSNLAIDVLGYSEGAQVVQDQPTGVLSQSWRFSKVNTGLEAVYTLTNLANRKCMGVGLAHYQGMPGVLSSSEHALVQVFTCNDALDQRWRLVEGALHDYLFINLKTGLCLDIPWGTVNPYVELQQAGCHGGPDQRWFFKSKKP